MLKDSWGRAIKYLRISVTDRCDLRCTYCMPPEGVPHLKHGDILRFEEIESVARTVIGLGIKNIRLTGGEPLARAGIVSLVQKLCAIPGLNDLAITTNGVLFSQFGPALFDAGLRRVNFGISSLDTYIYNKITRSDKLKTALDGLNTAIDLGFSPIKLNVVVLRGINEELGDFVTLAAEKPVHIRFIEYMPIGAADHSSFFVPASEIRKQLEANAELEPLVSTHNAQSTLHNCEKTGYGPSQGTDPIWRVRGGLGSMAIIAPMSEHVCATCNRLRLTADGKLRLCLFSKGEIDLKPALRPILDNEMLWTLFREAVANKPESLHETSDYGRNMSQIGG